MLRMSRAWPQDIGALAILDGAGLFDENRGRFRIDAARDVVASRLRLVPRLRQVIRAPRRGRGGPYWADAQAFDLGRHVRETYRWRRQPENRSCSPRSRSCARGASIGGTRCGACGS